MTAGSPPIVFQLDNDPGDAFTWIAISDLTDAFDRLEPDLEILTAFDLGIREANGRRAA
jgi:ABC-type glycerol-3-phosphate transport system substrate-binding protein